MQQTEKEINESSFHCSIVSLSGFDRTMKQWNNRTVEQGESIFIKLLFYLVILQLVVSCNSSPDSLFQQQPAELTAIHFENTITETEEYNILEYEFVYNGGGVAIADFNNDGWEDVFFSGNMVDNKLYLNQQNFEFKDITDQAGVAGQDRWCTGIAIADVNADGWMDMYIGSTTYEPASRRKNLLYINQGLGEDGIPTFEEMGAAYGLADSSHTMQSAFFDYDKDGDLDVYLAVNEMDDIHLPNKYRKKKEDGDTKRIDKLFRNDWDAAKGHPVFTDVSREAGILIDGFSLGLNISDINKDGWQDIYVTNDYLTNDLLYINNQDGTFTNKAAEYFKHTCYSAMGNDVVDINNDGLLDIVALDMLPEDNFRRKTMLPNNNYTGYINNEKYGYQHQYVRNVLQLNQGERPDTAGLLFSEIAMLSGVSSTDWSWAPVMADFDNDGYKDLIVTNGFPKDVTDRDFMDYHSDVGPYAGQEMLLSKIPSVKINNYAYRNRGDLTFEYMGEKWGITEPSFSNGAAYADLDNDGDMDYVVNNIDDPAAIFKNQTPASNPNAHWLKIQLKGTGKNLQGIGTIIILKYKNQTQYWEHSLTRGYLSSSSPIIHFGLGEHTIVDELVIKWQDGTSQVRSNISADQLLTIDQKNAGLAQKDKPIALTPIFEDVTKNYQLNYEHYEMDYIDYNVQPLLMHKLSQYGPGIAVGDINNDQLEDFYVSGSHFKRGRFFVQQAEGGFTMQDLLGEGVEKEKLEEELGSLLFDADMDGDLDLYLVSGGYEYTKENTVYQDRLFINDNGQFTKSETALPNILSSGSCVKAADFDKDGDLDLFVGGRVLSGEYPKPVDSYILKNETENGQVKFRIVNEEIAPELNQLGMVCDALWTDYNNDGWTDLLVAGEWMPLQIFKNKEGILSKESLTIKQSSNQTINPNGWWNSLVGGDFDKDGDIDYIAGNLGLNTLNKASEKYPISIYGADFDGNKGFDVVPAAYFLDEERVPQEFPFFGRGDIQKQMQIIRKHFRRHEEFARATATTMFSRFQEVEPLKLEANYLQTSYLENKGDGTFLLSALPTEAQFAPIYGMAAGDFNQDGHLDVLLSGNDYGMEVSMGRHDAFNGLLLLGNGEGDFQLTSMQESGVVIPQDAKSLVRVATNNGDVWVAGQNGGQLKFLQSPNSFNQPIAIQPLDAYAILTTNSGTSYRHEFYYGHTFLSQSSRIFFPPENIQQLEIFQFSGTSRIVNSEAN